MLDEIPNMLVNDIRLEMGSIASDGGNHMPAPPFVAVAVATSAGGLAALEAPISSTAGSGGTCILPPHKAPGHKNLLSGLIQRRARIQVAQAEDGMSVLADRTCVCMRPPGKMKEFILSHGFQPLSSRTTGRVYAIATTERPIKRGES